MTMRVSKNQGSHTWYTAEHERKLRRHAKPAATGGFDPNEDPVIIGSGATAGGGSTPSNVSAGTSGKVAIGKDADATGAQAIAIGLTATVDSLSPNGIAIGNGATATTRDKAIAIGWAAQAHGYGGVSLGNDAISNGSTGDSAIAIGPGAQADDDDAIAIGDIAQALFARSVAIGATVHTTATDQIMLGKSTWEVVMPGSVSMTGLPLSDPGVSGQLWNNSGVVTVSP